MKNGRQPGRNAHFLEVAILRYATGKPCEYHHRCKIVCSTKRRSQVLHGQLCLRAGDVCRQVCAERDVHIIKGVQSGDPVPMFVSVPPKPAISNSARLMKGRSPEKIQRALAQIKKRCWERCFRTCGYFSTTNGAISEKLALQYLEQDTANPTGAHR